MAKNEKKEEKAAKRRAKELWDQSEEMFAGGDYLTARRLAAEVAAVAPDSELGAEASARAENLSTIDSGALYALAGTVLLYLIGWGYALS